jgi:hypothetical protein
MTLPDDSPQQIVGWFRDRGWELRVHRNSPPRGDVPQALRSLPRFTYWADLVSLETGDVAAQWYAGGLNEAQAVSNARRRWGTEHGE